MTINYAEIHSIASTEWITTFVAITNSVKKEIQIEKTEKIKNNRKECRLLTS